FDLRGADVFREIEVGGEIELAGLRLVEVPKDVGAKGVEAHGAHLAHAVAPVGARDARVVHFAGPDEEGSVVEQELVALPRERAGFWLRESGEARNSRRLIGWFPQGVSACHARCWTARAAGRRPPASQDCAASAAKPKHEPAPKNGWSVRRRAAR